MTSAAFLVLVGGLGLAAVALVGLVQQRRATHERVRFEMEFPRSLALPQITDGALGALSGLPTATAAVFEVVAAPHRLRHYLVVPGKSRAFVEAAVRQALPGVRLTPVEEWAGPPWQRAVELRPTDRLAPLRAAAPAAVAGALLASLTSVRHGEAVVVQLVLRPATVPQPHPTESARRRRFHLTAWLIGREPLTGDTYAAQVRKVSGPMFTASLRVGVLAAYPDRRRALITSTLSAVRSLRAPGVRILRRLLPNALVVRRLIRATVAIDPPFLLNASEAAALLAWPVDTYVPGLYLSGGPQLPPAGHPRQGIVLGRATYPGREQLVAVRPRDLTRHQIIVGATGTGKTYAAAGQILATFRAGFGGVLLDPKGECVDLILDRLTADEADRVIVVDPRAERVIGLDLLAARPTERDAVVDNTVAALRRRFPDGLGPRSEDLARNALALLTLDVDGTFADLPALLGPTPTLRRTLVSRVDDPVLQAFWAEFEGWSPEQRAAVVGPLLNKVRSVLRGPIRAVVGQRSTIALDAVIARRQLLLVDLAAASIGYDAAGLLGGLVFDKVWTAVLRRHAVPVPARRPFFVYVDESPLLLNDAPALVDALAVGRSYGLGLCLLAQHLGQWSPATRAAVMANAQGVKQFFTLGAADAAEVARELAPSVSAESLQNLRPYEAVAAVTVDAVKLPPVTLRAEPLPEPTGQAATIRRQSSQRYGRDRAEVEARLRKRAGYGEGQGPVGRRRTG